MRKVATVALVAIMLLVACGGCPISSIPIQNLAIEYVSAANASIARDLDLDENSKTIRIAAGLKLLDALKRAGASLIGGR
jgi:hypothetical protein